MIKRYFARDLLDSRFPESKIEESVEQKDPTKCAPFELAIDGVTLKCTDMTDRTGCTKQPLKRE